VARLGLTTGFLLGALMLTGCTSQATGTPTATATLRLLASRTPSQTPGRPTHTQEPPTPSGPSPTPLTHLVEEGETLLGIAIEYGVELDDLITANPGISPRMLSIGQPVLIPGPDGAPVVILAPTATPVALRFSGPDCYAALSGGLWCLAWAENDAGAPLEGVAAAITLLDAQGVAVASQTAYSPLNLIREDQLIVVAAHFPQVNVAPARVAVTPVSALRLDDTSRYLPSQARLASEERLPSGVGWRLRGEIELGSEGETDVERGVVVAIGLDSEGRPVGLRTWEFQGTVAAGSVVPFELSVFTLGPEMESVAVFVEAQASDD
jgi:LysM repeat protein